MMDNLIKIIGLMALEKCMKVMDRYIWDSFCMERLMAKGLSYIVTDLFTKEIL